mmetsp:Transcript_14312/g.38609  ORF Transcript_14312/g.38609 Transcript_14312/m.38609 type:complete len:531 (+) Transcript_14312:72-1664(+)
MRAQTSLGNTLLKHAAGTLARTWYWPIKAVRHQFVPLDRWWWARRAIRTARVGLLAGGIYGAGKSAGHTEVLQDPDGMRRKVVLAHIQRSFEAEDERKKPRVYREFSAPYRRVAAVAPRVLQAAREHVDLQAAMAEREARDLGAQLKAERAAAKAGESTAAGVQSVQAALDTALSLREFWAAAQERLAGDWRWVVTNSELVNAFVTPYCPRCIFVMEGLLTRLDPSEEELAMVLSHELAHVVHGHGSQHLDYTFETAALQLVVLSVIDPTGVLELALSALLGLGALAWTKSFTRQCEREADETGMAILARACYDTAKGAAMMGKFAELEVGWTDSWMRSHPLPQDRLEALLDQSEAIRGEDGALDHCKREQLDLRRAFAALVRPRPGPRPASRPIPEGEQGQLLATPAAPAAMALAAPADALSAMEAGDSRDGMAERGPESVPVDDVSSGLFRAFVRQTVLSARGEVAPANSASWWSSQSSLVATQPRLESPTADDRLCPWDRDSIAAPRLEHGGTAHGGWGRGLVRTGS